MPGCCAGGFRAGAAHQLHHSTGQLRVGSNQVCVEPGVNDGLPNVIIVDQAGVNVGLLAFFCNAVTRGGIALRVKATMRTFLPSAATQEERLTQVVVLPTPPFWFAIAITFAIFTTLTVSFVIAKELIYYNTAAPFCGSPNPQKHKNTPRNVPRGTFWRKKAQEETVCPLNI